MKAKPVTLTVSTDGPTVQDQLDAMHEQWLLDRATHHAETYERSLQAMLRVMSGETDDGPRKEARGEQS